MWYKARKMRGQVRIELTNNGKKIQLVNHYSTGGALNVLFCSYLLILVVAQGRIYWAPSENRTL